MKKILILLTLFLANCQLGGSGDTVSLNLNDTIQAVYKAQWLQNTASITRENYYNSYFDWYGGGAYHNKVYFTEGSLRAINDHGNDCVLHELISFSVPHEDNYAPQRPNDWKYDMDLFIDGNTAIVVSPINNYYLYVLRIVDGKLYRTKENFSTYNTWDGITYSTNDLVEVTTQPK